MTDYKALVREMYGSIADREHIDENIDRYLAEDFVEHTAIPGMDSTREATRRFFTALHGAITDLHVDVHDLLQDGDEVAGRVTFGGVAEGGEDVAVDVIDIFAFRDDRCVAHWAQGDLAGMFAKATGSAAPDNAALVREMYDALMSGGRDGVRAAMERYLTEDFVEREELPGLGTDRAAATRLFEMMHGAMPDLRVEIHQLLQDGDDVAAFVTFSGTMTGEFMGVRPTGEQVRFPTVDLFAFRDGRIAVHSGVSDPSALSAPPSAVRSQSDVDRAR
jgi:predicted ester cyclase